jgi:hypothetical protein
VLVRAHLQFELFQFLLLARMRLLLAGFRRARRCSLQQVHGALYRTKEFTQARPHIR